MPKLLTDAQHLVRMGALFIAGIVVFLIARALLVPAGFGEFGHYRAGALDDNRAHPLAFAGRDACSECHDDVVAARHGSKHERIGCESCHGALATHAADPAARTAVKPTGDTVCLACHLDNAARPAGFPQVEPADHAQGNPCIDCHSPHHPEP